MDRDKWEEIREEHRVIAENMGRYLGTLEHAQRLIDSSQNLMELSKMLLSDYQNLRQLSHIADVQISKAGEALVIEMVRNHHRN